MIDYLDYFHCGTKSAGVFTCYHFQPNWTDLGETDGYPRFGRLDPVKAGYIDSSLVNEAVFYDQTLWNGAISLFSTAIAFVAVFLAF